MNNTSDPVLAPENRPETFFVGHYDHGRSDRGRASLKSSAVIAAVLVFIAWRFTAAPMGAEAQAGFIVLSVVLLAILGSTLMMVSRWLRHVVTTVTITANGISTDGRHWPWAEVESLRICASGFPGSAAHVELRPVRRAWRGRQVVPLPIDEHLSRAHCDEVAARIRRSLEGQGFAAKVSVA